MPSLYSNILLSNTLLSAQPKNRQARYLNKCKFISKVFTEVPFFYKDPEVEDFHWRKIASELTQDEILDRFAYGYNLSKERNTFGSVVNHLELMFYKLMLENDKTGNNTLIYSSYNHTDDHFESVKFRFHSVNGEYEYFLPEEIRSMIIGGLVNTTMNNHKNFFKNLQNSCLDDYDNVTEVLSDDELKCKFGVLFSMNESNYRTNYVKINTNKLKVSFFKMISKLELSSEVVPIYKANTGTDHESSCSCMCLDKLVSNQISNITDVYIPKLVAKLNEQVNFLIVEKKFSESRIKRRFAAVDHLKTQPIVLEVHLDLC